MSDLIPVTSDLDTLSDPAQAVIVSCERAKEWLLQALRGDDIEQIVELKSQAEAIRVYTMQKQLGKDAELSAAEVVRRAERCIGLAIRKGQADGKIAKQGQRRDRVGHEVSEVTAFASYADLSGSGAGPGFYAMADNVTDEQFEAAVAQAKSEKNLSRANVVRKVNGKTDKWSRLAKLAAEGNTSGQIAKRLGFGRDAVVRKAVKLGIEIPADRIVGKARRVDPNRVLREFVATLESLVPSCELIEVDKIDPDVLSGSLAVMDESMRALNGLRRRLRRGMNENG